MVSHVDHFDTIIVSSDKEAFILEMNLIQTHYPRYNIMPDSSNIGKKNLITKEEYDERRKETLNAK